MIRNARFAAALAAAAALGVLGCDNDREVANPPPTPPPAKMQEMMHESAIKDHPSEETGLPATRQSPPERPPDLRADDDIRRALKEGPGELPDAATPADDDGTN